MKTMNKVSNKGDTSTSLAATNEDLDEFLRNQTLPSDVSRQIHRGSVHRSTGHIRSQTTVMPTQTDQKGTSPHQLPEMVGNYSLLIG